MRDFIYVYMKEPKIKVLGPGERFVLWVQGCEKNCPGCVAKNAKKMKEGKAIEIGALAYEIILSGAKGITISGGEPFLQAEELTLLLQKVRKKKDIGVIVYTGYLYEDLQKDESARKLLSQIDLLVDGPYIQELDDGLSLRGSSNQRVISLTGRYDEYLDEYGTGKRENEIFEHGIYVHQVGIPDNKET